MDRDILVLEKLHPSDERKKPPSTANNIHWHVEGGSDDLWPLLLHADIIIGMNTMALLQAAILGKNPISYQPGAFNPNLCTAVRLGLAELHTAKGTLARRLPILLKKKQKSPEYPRSLPCSPPDAAKRVCMVAWELMR